MSRVAFHELEIHAIASAGGKVHSLPLVPFEESSRGPSLDLLDVLAT